MLSIKTLFQKPESVDRYGDPIIDLSYSTFSFNSNISIIATGIVTTDLEMRPDLVAKIYYKDISKIDYLLKFNGISNPFSLEAGTIVLIGDETEMSNCFSSGKIADPDKKQTDIRTKFFDPNRLSKKDAKRLTLIQQKSQTFTNGASNLPPNMADIGSQEIKIKDGVVIFGGDVVANAKDCPTVLSRAVLKSKLISKKIFNT